MACDGPELVIQFPPEMVENWWRYGGELVTKQSKLAENCCLVHTQHNFCTQQLKYVGITVVVILFYLVKVVCRKSRQIAFRRSWKRSCLGVGVYLQQLTVGSFVRAQLG